MTVIVNTFPCIGSEVDVFIIKIKIWLSAGDAKAIVKENSRIQNKEVVPGPHSTTVHIAGQSGISARGRRPPIENVGEELIDSDSDSGYDDVESILTKVWTNLWEQESEIYIFPFVNQVSAVDQ